MVEGLVAPLLARERLLADDAQRQRRDGEQQQRAAGGGQELRGQHRQEGVGRHQEQRAGEDRGAGDHDEQARPPEAIDQRAEGAAEQQRARAHQRGDEPDLRRAPLPHLREPRAEEWPEPALDVADEDVDQGEVGGGRHAVLEG